MSEKRIDASELQPGDVLLSFGDSEISEGIVELDGGRYSHAALWSGAEVLESTLPEVRAASLAECAAHARYIDVFRHRHTHVDRATVVGLAREYLGRPYGMQDLALTTLLLAVSSWMPNDWSEMATLHGAGSLERMIRLLLKLKAQSDEHELVTCSGLVVSAHDRADAPLIVLLHGGRQLNGVAFLRALKALCARLAESHAAESRARGGASLFEPGLPASDGVIGEVRWLLALPDPTGVGTVVPRSEEWAGIRYGFWVALGLVDARAEENERLGSWSTQALVQKQLRAGRDWAASLATPRQLESSPDLERLGRVHG
jgi:hypothetical protein